MKIIIEDKILKSWVFENQKHTIWWIKILIEANGEGFIDKSLNDWSVLLNTSPRTVSRFFKKLQQSGFLEISVMGKGNKKILRITIINLKINWSNNIAKKYSPTKKKTIKKTTDSKEPRKPGKIKIKTWDQNYLNFVEYLNLKKGATHIKREEIEVEYRKRIKEGYKPTDFILAVKNVMQDEFHKKNKFKNITPEFLTRPDILDKFCNISKTAKNSVSGIE